MRDNGQERLDIDAALLMQHRVDLILFCLLSKLLALATKLIIILHPVVAQRLSHCADMCDVTAWLVLLVEARICDRVSWV